MVKLDEFAKFMNFKLRRKAAAVASPLGNEGALQDGESTRLLERLQSLIHMILNARASASSDVAVTQLSNEYYNLNLTNRHQALKLLATEYGVDRANVRSLTQQYLGLCQRGTEFKQVENIPALYRTEQSLRSALTPLSAQLFKQINFQPGGLKFLVDLRADLRTFIEEQNLPAFRHLDACLKEVLETALTPAGLELHLFTWDDPASNLEKIVMFEAVHPISNLYDLKRRLGPGRRCFGYFHPSLPGEPLIFIEVALTRSVLGSIQDVLRYETPMPEDEATTALFYSISSTQPGLAGISLGKLLIKRVVSVLQREMPKIEVNLLFRSLLINLDILQYLNIDTCQAQTFATLSPIPGFMAWLLAKLASQVHSLSSGIIQEDAEQRNVFKEDLLHAEEEITLVESCGAMAGDTQQAEVVLWNILTSQRHEWTRSESLQKVLKPILLRLCARYLLKEKRRGKALDAVTNFHVQNGAVVERLNWMGDCSEWGLAQSAGIMVNYIYRLDNIEENIEQYVEKGVILSSPAVTDLMVPE